MTGARGPRTRRGRLRRGGARRGARESLLRLVGMVLSGVVPACVGGDAGRVRFVPPPTPATLAAGESLFNSHCARCHGVYAVGTDSGPPLIHMVYRSSHHGDEAFRIAVRLGVRAHHWRFGDMPPQPQVPDSQVPPIRDYVRWLQRSAGIR